MIYFMLDDLRGEAFKSTGPLLEGLILIFNRYFLISSMICQSASSAGSDLIARNSGSRIIGRIIECLPYHSL